MSVESEGSEASAAPEEEPVVAQAPAAPRDRTAIPSAESLMNPAFTPYHHNPLRWSYLSRQRIGDGVPSEILVHMVTTAEREVVEGMGLAMTLVTEMEAPPQGMGDTATPAFVSIGYQARIAVLNERGLTISDPNPAIGDLQAQPSDAPMVLAGSPPTWPLPGAEGCTGSPGVFELPVGVVAGVLTDCPVFDAHMGTAHVRTVWVDQVGFAYREIRLEALSGVRVYSDYLISADVAELAPGAPEGTAPESIERLLP